MLCPLESELRTGGNDQLKATSANVEAKRAAGRKAAVVRHGMRVGAGKVDCSRVHQDAR